MLSMLSRLFLGTKRAVISRGLENVTSWAYFPRKITVKHPYSVKRPSLTAFQKVEDLQRKLQCPVSTLGHPDRCTELQFLTYCVSLPVHLPHKQFFLGELFSRIALKYGVIAYVIHRRVYQRLSCILWSSIGMTTIDRTPLHVAEVDYSVYVIAVYSHPAVDRAETI